MDYICATALVAYQLFGLFARLLVFRDRRYLVIASIFTALLCGQHVYRMLFIHFDYGYHVKVNVIVGKLSWCLDRNAILFEVNALLTCLCSVILSAKWWSYTNVTCSCLRVVMAKANDTTLKCNDDDGDDLFKNL